MHLVGRFQMINPGEDSPAWVLDVAHNPDAARVLATNLKADPIPGRTLAVCGILADKDAAGIVSVLDGCIDSWWCASVEGTRGRSGAALAEEVRKVVRTPVVAADSVAVPVPRRSSAAKPLDRIIVFGSFHTVGPAMDWLESKGLLPTAARREYTSP